MKAYVNILCNRLYYTDMSRHVLIYLQTIILNYESKKYIRTYRDCP